MFQVLETSKASVDQRSQSYKDSQSSHRLKFALEALLQAPHVLLSLQTERLEIPALTVK